MAQTINKTDIPACIGELLHLQDTVILPGLGAFEGTYKAAVVDSVQGVVHPPSRKLRFNPNLKLNDGTLVDLIARNNNWSLSKAQAELDAYVSRLQQALEKREIVEIPGVARLYIDFEGQYKLMQGPENFHTPSFGLPEVKFNPVKRKPVQATAPDPIAAIRPGPLPFWKKINWRSPVLWLLSLAVLILIVSIAFLAGNMNRIPNSGIALSPSPVTTTDPQNEFDDEEPELDEDNAFVTGNLGELVDTEGATRVPGLKEAIVIIGSFKDDSNAEKQIQAIFSDGYEAYSDQPNGVTRVGIRLGYETEDQLQEQLKVIQARYNKKAWVFTPEAE